MLVGGPNHLPRMEELFVFVAKDRKTGNEGTCGFLFADVWHPLVTSDRSQLGLLRVAAKRITRESKHEITLVRFSQREELETIDV